LVGAVSGSLPIALLPVIVFIISSLISIATGTAWGTMAIVVPLALPLAESYVEMGADPNMLIVTISTVLSGAILGDHISPISDTTIMSSMAAGADHLDHVSTQMPYAMIVAAVSIICYLIKGITGAPAALVLILGLALIYIIVRFRGKSVLEEDLKRETVKIK
jgi:Na+/H+ antiporter NhaC